MRCTTCDYPLWNLRERRCPECGDPFAPTDHHFTPNAVRFCCPHCDQNYYGTGERGELVPDHFTCVTCGQAVTMDEMIVRPHDPDKEQYAVVEPLPWIRRRRDGTIRSWWRTLLFGIHSPHRIAEAVPPDSSGWSPVGFMVLTLAMLMLIGYGGPGAVFDVLLPMLSGVPVGGLSPNMVIGGLTVLVPVLALSLVWIPLAHGLLRITGPVAHPMRRTSQAIGYTVGSGVLLGFPFCGVFFGWIWWAISVAIAICFAQKVHWARGLLAVTIPPLLSISVPIVLWIALVLPMMNQIGAQAPSVQRIVSSQIAQAITDYTTAHGGTPPKHGIDLFVWTQTWPTPLSANQLVLFDTQTMPSDVPLGTGTLAEFLIGNTSSRSALATDARSSLPDTVVAHRLGDFVFTHHQIDVANALPGLWLVVVLPDPDVPGNAPLQPQDQVIIGVLGRPSQQVPVSGLPRALEVQNKMRTSLGLPPLPDLRTVTHSNPARASDVP